MPPTAESPVQLHQALIFASSYLRECQFFGLQQPLPVQDFQGVVVPTVRMFDGRGDSCRSATQGAPNRRPSPFPKFPRAPSPAPLPKCNVFSPPITIKGG